MCANRALDGPEVIRRKPELRERRERLSAFWWNVCHPTKESHWVPPWRRHKKVCSEEFQDALADGRLAELHGHTYCATCDYIEVSPRKNRLLWLLLIVPFAIENSRQGYR